MIPNDIKDLNVKTSEEYVSIDESNLSDIFLLDNDEYIAMTNIVISGDDICSKARDLLEALIIDGEKQDIIPNGFKPIIPTGTTINDVNYDNGVLKVDFSKDILEINEKYEEKMIEAICYTLTSIKDVKNILIYVDGNLLVKLPKSGKYLPDILDRNYGINKEVNISNYKNVMDITLYYTKVYKDSYYYVPVTKYVNSDKDKVKIIIDELSSAPTYEENLMSFLDSNTKLLNYNIDNKVLSLEFNEYVIEDMNTMGISEEVKEAISYSMKDNLDIDEIIFMFNNKEITKTEYK